jgi:predicted  nucleic acid-binding Zn-ribbon protein
LWLAGLQASRVKADLRDKLVQYQQEAAVVLWQAFKPQILKDEAALELVDDQVIRQLQHIVELGYAIARMGEQQIELQRQHQALAGRMDSAARVIRDVQGHLQHVEVRLGVLEDQLHPASYITDEQATEVSNQVKALAEWLTGTDKAKNHYQGIFAELYRRFGVSSYKLIRQEQYTPVLQFLEAWRTASSG